MIDFGVNKKGNAPAFSLNKRDQMSRQTMRKREWRAAIMLPFAIAAVIYFVYQSFHVVQDATARPKIVDESIAAMPQPILADASPLPTAAAIDGMVEGARELMKNPQGVYLHIGELDALTLAWMREQLALDAAAPPIPQRLNARDLIAGDLHAGVPALISGRIEDSVAAVPEGMADGYQRLLLSLDDHQFAEVLAPPEAGSLVIGHEVQVVGRFLGHDTMPTASGVAVKVPLVAARVVAENDRAASELGLEREWQSGGEWTMPADLFSDLSDERTIIETRPYYYLLGQVKLDLSTPDAYAKVLDGNARANDIHQDPDKFRNVPMRFTATVYRAWEDPDVARDQPFGVSRCVRILAYHSDFGPITENIDGVEKTRTRIVQRMYEFAVTGSQPIPQQGALISAIGRFMKFHALPVKENQARDRAHQVQRQSDKVYTYFLIANGYSEAPPAPPARFHYPLWGLIVTLVILALLTVFWFQMRRENRQADQVQVQVRKFRDTRRGLRGKLAGVPARAVLAVTGPTAPTAPTTTASEDPAPAPPADPPAPDLGS
ncbi:MAG: hypothetical protein H0W83_08310 [Planctomycetes bacterium]|nr:hypothetical protein [Planctomycetota bacterium]